MPEIKIKENEYFDVALRRFRKTVERAGVFTELRARESYEKPTTERKRKLIAAIKRQYRKDRINNILSGAITPVRRKAAPLKKNGKPVYRKPPSSGYNREYSN